MDSSTTSRVSDLLLFLPFSLFPSPVVVRGLQGARHIHSQSARLVSCKATRGDELRIASIFLGRMDCRILRAVWRTGDH